MWLGMLVIWQLLEAHEEYDVMKLQGDGVSALVFWTAPISGMCWTGGESGGTKGETGVVS
jgi:hypothetical protein